MPTPRELGLLLDLVEGDDGFWPDDNGAEELVQLGWAVKSIDTWEKDGYEYAQDRFNPTPDGELALRCARLALRTA